MVEAVPVRMKQAERRSPGRKAGEFKQAVEFEPILERRIR